jgi:threonine synthase
MLPRGVASLSGRRERFDRLPGDADTIKAYVRAFAEA